MGIEPLLCLGVAFEKIECKPSKEVTDFGKVIAIERTVNYVRPGGVTITAVHDAI